MNAAPFKIPFMQWRRTGLIASIVLSVLAVAATAVWGLNLTVDFTGGSLWTLRFEQPTSEATLREVFRGHGVNDAVIQQVSSDQGHEFVVRTVPIDEATREAVRQEMESAAGAFEVISLDDVSPTIGREIQRNAVLALSVAMLGMIAYISLRFELRFALTAIASVLHDILVVIGVFAAFRLPVDAAFVAALLTTFGYSVNDTIIVFDRIRENLRERSRKRGDWLELVNLSINQTLMRSINTSLTTGLAVTALVLFGGVTVKPFAVALLVGILAGTYSSIFIASALWLEWRLASDRKQREVAT